MNAQRLALGAAQFGLPYGVANLAGQVSPEEMVSILDMAARSGADTIDTAIAYGDSETRLGRLGVGNWRIVSKLPRMPEDCRDAAAWTRDSVVASLNRLGIECLDGLLLHHSPDASGPRGDEIVAGLAEVRREGLARKIGVSVYQPEELEAVLERMEIDLVQAPFNILDRRLVDSGWLERLKATGVELHVRSIFLQGLLLMTPERRPPYFDRWRTLWSSWEQWLEDENISPLQACLRYVLSFSSIERVVVGVDNIAQLEQILAAAAGEMPPVPPELQSTDIDLLNPAKWPRS